MKRKLLFAAALVVGALGFNVHAQDVYIETDLTSQFSSLLDYRNWKGATGFATWAAPKVTTKSGTETYVCERFESKCDLEGDVFYQIVEGLAAGTYTIELFGSAAYTGGRDKDMPSSFFENNGAGDNWANAYSEDPKLTDTQIYLYANDVQQEIPAYKATTFSTVSEVKLENVEVGEEGTIRIGLKKTSKGTNWHVVQLKGVTATVNGTQLLANLKEQANSLLSNVYKNVLDADEAKKALLEALNAQPEATSDAYKKATDDLQKAIAAFEKVNYQAYDEYFYEKQTAERLNTDITSVVAPVSADEAEEAAHKINVLNYEEVQAQGYKDVSDGVLGAWTDKNVASRHDQHYDGTTTSEYFEMDTGYGDPQWTMSREQDITTLLPGDYILQVAARVSAYADATLSVTIGDKVISTAAAHHGDIGLGITTDGVASYVPHDENAENSPKYANDNKGRGFEWRYIPFTVSEERQTVTLSFAAEGKAINQYVSFTSLGILTNPLAATKTNLLAEINNAETIIDAKINVGEGVFQIPEDAHNTLAKAVSEAKKVVETANNLEDLESALEQLQKAVTTYREVKLNEPEKGKLYNIINITEGADFNGNALTFLSESNADLTGNTTSIAWREEPGSIHPQGVKFFVVDAEKNQYKLGYARANGTVVYIGTGKSTGLDDQKRATTLRPTTDDKKALVVEIKIDRDGVWKLYNTEAERSIGASAKDNDGFFTQNDEYSDVKFQEAAETSVKVEVTNKYGTLIVPFDAEKPENLTVYTVDTNGKDYLTLQEEETIKANTPYIVYANGEVDATLSGIGAAYTDKTYTDGFLTGGYEKIEITSITDDGNKNYVLQTPEGGEQAFYRVPSKATNENKFPIPANRCYLTLSETEGKIRLVFGDNDATAIEAIPELAEDTEKVFYNLAGQRVANPTKGIYIVNGKKVLVK